MNYFLVFLSLIQWENPPLLSVLSSAFTLYYCNIFSQEVTGFVMRINTLLRCVIFIMCSYQARFYLPSCQICKTVTPHVQWICGLMQDKCYE